MTVVATAGHVDHGKSTLVAALTGVNPDRWPEEKARGLTIDLGFATALLPSGVEVAFVDVPGHERFVRNMLAGAGAVDACLFVVAATEGWKEQSEEHLRILDLLGARAGVVALTKCCSVDPDWAELVRLDLQDRVAGTFLAGAEIVSVDVPAELGLPRLRDALDRLAQRLPPTPDRDRPRLWIDRSFAVHGSGTVVTGTLAGGGLAVDDEVTVHPAGLTGRIRGLQSDHRPVPRSDPGRRLAVNLNGVPHRSVGRGHALVQPGDWHLTSCFDASLTVLADLGHPVSRRGAYSLHVGTAQLPARMRILGGTRVEPGEQAPVRFWVTSAGGIPLVPGDRYVLREAGRSETVGGGVILDVEPVLSPRHASPSLSTDRVIRERGWVDASHLARITGERIAPTVGRWVVSDDALAATRQAVVERCAAAGPAGVDLAGFGGRERALIQAGCDGVVVRAGRAVCAGADGPDLSPAAQRVLAELEAARWSPPTLPVSERGALRELQRAGLAVESGEAWFAASAVEAAVPVVRDLLESRSGGFTAGEARDALGTSRRHALPLLAHLDGCGLTRRQGDRRVAGPRLGGGNTTPGSMRQEKL